MLYNKCLSVLLIAKLLRDNDVVLFGRLRPRNEPKLLVGPISRRMSKSYLFTKRFNLVHWCLPDPANLTEGAGPE